MPCQAVPCRVPRTPQRPLPARGEPRTRPAASPRGRALATARDAAAARGPRPAALRGPRALPLAPPPGAAMSDPRPGFLATYNSLTDKHLAGYFSNTRIRRHLQRSGLISRSGRIIPEKEYRLNAMRRDHQRYVQECLARAIFLKVLDMERHHQLEIKRKLESSVRKERVLQKNKVERSRRSVIGASPVHSPHPPLGPRNHYGLHPLVAGEPTSHSQMRAPGLTDYSGGHPSYQHRSKETSFFKITSCRPHTAPGNMQHRLRLQPLHSCAVVGSVPKTSSSKQKCHALENDQQLASGGEKTELRLMNSVELSKSPYRLPVINNYVIPVPPPPLQKGDKSVKATRNGMPRGRRFCPPTAPNGLEQLLTKNSGGLPKPSLRSNAFVTMIFLGKSVHLSHDDADYKDEVKVCQQHCGGENLCVYKGKLLEGETFQFVSKRHHGFPFSLTFFLNGMQVDRLSSCCEYKHQKRSRLGGRHGYFGFLNVEGASPCYRCIIAMGLDKKPSPPKRTMEKDYEEKQVGSWKGGVHSEPSDSSVEQKSSKDLVLVILPGHKASVETIEEKMETGQEYRGEERKKLFNHETEDSQEDTGKNDYDEDFEAEEVNEEGQTSDQRNGMSKSSPDDEKHNLDYEKEGENSSQKALQASVSERDESDGYSDSDLEDDKQDWRSAHSLSSTSAQYSSGDDSDVEKMVENVKGKEEYDIKKASDNTAHAQYGNENGENKLFKTEANQETFTLEKEGIREAEKTKPEDLRAGEDTEIFHENIMAIQHQSPEVNWELRQAGAVESNIKEDGEKNASNKRDNGEKDVLVPLENNMMEVENRNEEFPQSDEGGAPDGAFLAEGTRARDVQKAAEQEARGGQVAGQRQAPVEEGRVAEEGDTHTDEAGWEAARAADVLPEGEVVAMVPAAGQLAVEGLAPARGGMAEGDAKEKEPGKGVPGAEVVAGGQKAVKKVMESAGALQELGSEGEEPAGVGGPAGREADGAVSGSGEGAGELSGGGEAMEKASGVEKAVGMAEPLLKEAVGDTMSEAEEAVEEGRFAGKGIVEDAVCEGEEAVEDANLVEEEITGVAGLEGAEAVEEAISEGEEAVEKPGALRETLGDTKVCTGREELKPNEFSQLKASGEEKAEMKDAAKGTATSETDRPPEVEESSVPRAEEVVEESVDAGKGPVLQVASGLGALVEAGRDPASEGSSPLEQTATAGDEEGLAEALLTGNPSLGSEAKPDGAMGEELDGLVMGVSAEKAGAELGGGGVMGGVAGPQELEAAEQGLLECATDRDGIVLGAGSAPGEEVVEEPALPTEGLCESTAGEAAGTAVGKAGNGGGLEPVGGAVGLEAVVAGDGRMGDEVGAWERGTEAGAGGQSRMGVAVAEGPAAQGGTVQAGAQVEGKQSGLSEGAQKRKAEGVLEDAQGDSGAQEQRKESPVRGSPDAGAAATNGSCREDVVNLDAAVMPSIGPQDKEETVL
ncbi:LOW QUALITY PROTEIN: glutamate-rich protein 3 [Cygnus atratus]|uniref:LOW QUALITY PROTEIN: glutamate-rich protein 3 n=1 Tax=Cygnus atratus TaxID=8868 RepID=UPI0021B7D0E2|nr:LOW QUALITY PROTEIN: glutamate-rich protein 3 [Cygnus atratus]